MIEINNQPLIVSYFPNGEMMLRKKDIQTLFRADGSDNVVLYYENDSDLFNLMMLRKGMWFNANLHLPYVPYSRMDRKSDHYVFTLKTFCKYINWLDFSQVFIYEPHSDVTPALLNRCRIVPIAVNLLFKSPFNRYKHYVLYPDAGAHKRYSDEVKENHMLMGLKNRDFKTGKITNYEIVGSFPTGSTIYILDDLCSKGGTFMLAARALKELGAGEINLVVAHCESTILKGEILTTDLISNIYTTNSLMNPQIKDDHKKIHLFDVLDFYKKI